MKMRCLIIDDEPLAVNIIKNFVSQFEDYEVVSCFGNAIEAVEFLKNYQVDVIFLDINMPLVDGISFLKNLHNAPHVIVTSAYKEYALETYELDVLDYLIKPIEFSRFEKAIAKVNKRANLENKIDNQQERPSIFIKIDKKRMKKIFLDEITLVESLKDYLKINTTAGRYIIHGTLSDFTEQLPSDNFIRIHRSYTVAINKIEAVEGNKIEIEGLQYVIGRSYLEFVKPRLNHLFK